MGKKSQKFNEGSRNVAINNLNDLIRLNLDTLEDVMSGSIDNKKAALIFTGSRTVSSSLKLGLEAMKLGITEIGGVGVSTPTPLKNKLSNQRSNSNTE